MAVIPPEELYPGPPIRDESKNPDVLDTQYENFRIEVKRICDAFNHENAETSSKFSQVSEFIKLFNSTDDLSAEMAILSRSTAMIMFYWVEEQQSVDGAVCGVEDIKNQLNQIIGVSA